MFQRLLHGLENGFDGHLGFGFSDAGSVDYLVDNIELDQVPLLTDPHIWLNRSGRIPAAQQRRQSKPGVLTAPPTSPASL